MYAHLAGLPLEETALGLMPVAGVAVASAIAFAGRARRTLRLRRGWPGGKTR